MSLDRNQRNKQCCVFLKTAKGKRCCLYATIWTDLHTNSHIKIIQVWHELTKSSAIQSCLQMCQWGVGDLHTRAKLAERKRCKILITFGVKPFGANPNCSPHSSPCKSDETLPFSQTPAPVKSSPSACAANHMSTRNNVIILPPTSALLRTSPGHCPSTETAQSEFTRTKDIL